MNKGINKWNFPKTYNKYEKKVSKIMKEALEEIKPKNQKEVFLLEYALTSTIHTKSFMFLLKKSCEEAKKRLENE